MAVNFSKAFREVIEAQIADWEKLGWVAPQALKVSAGQVWVFDPFTGTSTPLAPPPAMQTAAVSYSPSTLTPEGQDAEAERRNCVVKRPKANELFIDLDTASAFETFKTMLPMLERFYAVRNWVATPSASGGQHRHVVVTLGGDVSARDRIMLQALLGSDLKREMLSLERLEDGSSQPTIFFEPKSGPRQVVKTGHNCTVCNQRNDFAEANQDDGTYVCFNCRVE